MWLALPEEVCRAYAAEELAAQVSSVPVMMPRVEVVNGVTIPVAGVFIGTNAPVVP